MHKKFTPAKLKALKHPEQLKIDDVVVAVKGAKIVVSDYEPQNMKLFFNVTKACTYANSLLKDGGK